MPRKKIDKSEKDRVSGQVDTVVIICSRCKWGEHKNGDESICYWAYKNRDKFPYLPFYAEIAESQCRGIFHGSTDHWWPRHVKEDDAKKCDVFKSKL